MFEEDQHEIEQIPMAQARAMLSRLPEILGKDNRTAALTVDGKPVLITARRPCGWEACVGCCRGTCMSL